MASNFRVVTDGTKGPQRVGRPGKGCRQIGQVPVFANTHVKMRVFVR